jgi:hypothetical protein
MPAGCRRQAGLLFHQLRKRITSAAALLSFRAASEA